MAPPHQIHDPAPAHGSIDADTDPAAMPDVRRAEKTLAIDQKPLQVGLGFHGDAGPAFLDFEHGEGLPRGAKVSTDEPRS